MTTYIVQDGDTFERISTISYGTPAQADLIKSANPQTTGGLSTGMVLTIPDLNDVPPLPTADVPSSRENEVSISIDGKPFRFWTSMTLRRSMDRPDTFSMSAPFEPTNQEFRDLFKPLKYQNVVINVGGSPLFTGIVMNIQPKFDISGRTVDVNGYARSALLNDVTMPLGSPDSVMQFQDTNLRDIVIAQARLFGLNPVFPEDVGPVFPDDTAIDASGKVLPFWIGLAKQRNLVIGNTPLGMPLFQRTSRELPIQNLEGGSSPVVSVDPLFNPQAYYSNITGLTPADWLQEGAQFTVDNPHLNNIVRPHAFVSPDTSGVDGLEAVKAKMGRMFANAISFRVGLTGWRDVFRELWTPNTHIRLLAPGAMIYNSTDLLIRGVTLVREKEIEKSELELVLPGSFEGVIPEVLPWD